MKTAFILLASVLISSNVFAVELAELESETVQELLIFYDIKELLSVSFFPVVTRKAPGYSYVITSEQIEKSPARSLRDVIEMRVPGMTTGGHERHGPLIGTRGIFIDNNAKTMVMLDEQQINQRGHFGYTTGLLSPLLGDIKTVEVILGPGAILHGSGALNGFINQIPKNGEDNPGTFVNAEYGFAEKLWMVETGHGASYGKEKNYFIYGGAYGAEGYEPDELYGYTKTFDVNSNGYDGGNYRFSLYWNHDNFNLNTFYYENNPFKNSSVEIGTFHQAALGIRPKYVFKINNTDSFEINGSLLWFEHRSPRNLPPTNEIQDRGGAENHWEIKNIYRTTRWDRHSLAAGFSFGKKYFFERKQFFGDDAETSIGTLDTEWQELGIFFEDVMALTDSWTASLGLRYDKIYLSDMSFELWTGDKTPDEIKGHFSPRIATAYELDADTTVKASYQHGFRTPDAFYYGLNLLYRDVAESLGFSTTVPPLGVETMDSYELNLLKDLPEHKLKLDLSLFYNIFRDQLSFKFYDDIGLFTPAERDAMKADQGLPSFVRLGSFLNTEEKIKAYGGEINVTSQPLSHTEIRLSYGYVQLVNAEQMQYPVHQIKLNTLHFVNDKLSLGLGYLYNSRYTESDLPSADNIYRKDRHTVNIALNYNIKRNAIIGVSVHNLFKSNVPPMVFDPDRLDKGGLGFDERRVYVAFSLKL